jgi:hypothetical protein
LENVIERFTNILATREQHEKVQSERLVEAMQNAFLSKPAFDDAIRKLQQLEDAQLQNRS